MVYIFVQPSLAIKFVNWLDVDSKPNIWVIFFSLMIHTQHRWSMKRRVSTQLAFGRIHETCHWFGMLTFIRKWMLKKGIQIKIHQKLTINDVKCSQYRTFTFRIPKINQSIHFNLFIRRSYFYSKLITFRLARSWRTPPQNVWEKVFLFPIAWAEWI